LAVHGQDNVGAAVGERAHRLHTDTGGCTGDHDPATGKVNTSRNLSGGAGKTKRF
jgi:hypothetical protein